MRFALTDASNIAAKSSVGSDTAAPGHSMNGFGVRRSAFGVRRSAFGVRRSAFRVQGSEFGFWVLGSGFWVLGSGFWVLVQGFWFGVHGSAVQGSTAEPTHEREPGTGTREPENP